MFSTKMMKWPQRSYQVQVQSINGWLPRSSWLTSGPPRIIQFWESLEHKYKSPSVQWARPFCNTQTFLFYLKTLQLFSLLISITASSQLKSSKSDKSTSLSTFGVGFSRQGGSTNPFFKNVGKKNPFSKNLQFCWYLNNTPHQRTSPKVLSNPKLPNSILLKRKCKF